MQYLRIQRPTSADRPGNAVHIIIAGRRQVVLLAAGKEETREQEAVITHVIILFT